MLLIENLTIKGYEFDATICLGDLSEALCRNLNIVGDPDDQIEIFGDYEVNWDGSDPLPNILSVYVVFMGENHKLSTFDIDYSVIAEEIKEREDTYIDTWYQDLQERTFQTH